MAKSKKTKRSGSANTFGSRLRAVRKSLKMRQKDFVQGLKISTTHLSEIELDKSKPGHDFFYNIVRNYHVNLYYLLFGDGKMFYGGNEEIVKDVKQIKTGDKHIDKFLYYFFNSPMVYNYLMYQFHKLYVESNEAIKKEIENSFEE